MIYMMTPTFSEGVGMVGDSECNPLINDRDTYVILTGMVPYIARVPGKFVAPGAAK